MKVVYFVCPAGSEYVLFETQREFDAETFAYNYTGFYKSLEIKKHFLKDATEEEIEKFK